MPLGHYSKNSVILNPTPQDDEVSRLHVGLDGPNLKVAGLIPALLQSLDVALENLFQFLYDIYTGTEIEGAIASGQVANRKLIPGTAFQLDQTDYIQTVGKSSEAEASIDQQSQIKLEVPVDSTLGAQFPAFETEDHERRNEENNEDEEHPMDQDDLHSAAAGDHTGIVTQYLIKKLGYTLACRSYKSLQRPAFWSGRVKTVKVLQSVDGTYHGYNFAQMTPLVRSVALNDLDGVYSALKSDPEQDPVTHQLSSALHIALRNGNPDTADVLLDYAADHGGLHLVDNLGTSQQDLQNALLLAVYRKCVRLASLVIDLGADPNARIDIYGSYLQYACTLGDVEMARVLITHGARTSHLCPLTLGCSPLMAAVSVGNKDLVRLLIKNLPRSSIGAEFGYFGNAIQTAAFFGHLDLIDTLIYESSPILNGAVNSYYKYHPSCAIGCSFRPYGVLCSPLGMAILGNHKAVAQKLVKHGAELDLWDASILGYRQEEFLSTS